MNAFDVILVLIVVVSTIAGLAKGLVREVFSLAGVLLGILLALIFGPGLGLFLGRWIPYESAAYAAASVLAVMLLAAGLGLWHYGRPACRHFRENRALAHFGLKVLRRSPRSGIRALCEKLRHQRCHFDKESVYMKSVGLRYVNCKDQKALHIVAKNAMNFLLNWCFKMLYILTE